MKRLLNLLSLSHHELRKKLNTAELKLYTLEQTVKEDSYGEFMSQLKDLENEFIDKIMKKLDESNTVKLLRVENERLRQDKKNLKNQLITSKAKKKNGKVNKNG